MNEEQIKAILSVRPANKLEKVSYEYLEELSINQATEIIVLQQQNKELHNKIDKAIEYIKKYQQIYDIDGSIEKQIDEFNILASPKRLLEILKDSDADE